MSKKITLENVDSSELPEIPVIGEVKQIRFTQDMELVSTLADSDLFMIQAGADLEARPNTITFDLIIKNLSGPIEEGSKKFVTGDMMFKVIGDMNLLDTWDNTNLVNSLNATYVNVRRIEEELRREINRSTGKDEQHDEQIANLRQDLTSTNEMLNQEINRSVAKDKEHDELLEGLRDDVYSISSKLDAEIDRSTAKDAEHDTLLKGLRVDVNANKSAIESEVARSTARDEDHDAAISKNASDIATETSRAKAEEAKIRQEMKTADTNLQNAITAETERATGVEEDLQRQITDLSGSTDDRLEALEALSHEQNTDTGTTSKTFVIDSGNTGAMLKAEGGGLSTRTKGDAGYANFTVQNLVIKGDVTQEGDTFITQAERVEVRDNMILINEGETGAGVTAGFAGIEVDRGTEQNFMFGFNESDGMFKIGKEGNMFDVALRQPVGDMIDGMFASWDAATKTFKTTNVIPYNKSLDFKFDPEIVDATLKMKFMEAGLGLSMSGDDSILALLPGMPQDEVKYSLISTNTNGIILGDSSGSNDKFILDIKKPSFISPVLDKNVIIGGKNAYFSYYSHSVGSPNTIIASCGVKAPSFYRASDNAEVLYSLDQARLTDGMFLSWDADNKKVVTTNKVPYGGKLYLAFDDVYITQDGRSIEFHTNDYWWRANTSSSNTMFSSSSGLFDFSGNIIVNNKVQTTASTLRLETTGKCLSIGNNGTSTLDTTLKANTFYRFSDSSEVLYQADLKSVLTGKETNYAPTVKAVSDAIDAVNTGTTESLKNYLKLSGGTMTGSIIMNNSIVLKSKDNNGVERRLIGKSIEGTTHIGDIDGKAQIYTSDTDVIHFRSTGSYKILDSYNLPDPATKSGNNAFTGTNSFVANKFSVGSFKVDRNSNLEVNIPYKENVTAWERSLSFMYNSLEDTRVSFGSMTSGTAADYAYIGVGNVNYSTAQYKFYKNRIVISNFGGIYANDNRVFLVNEDSIYFGSNNKNTYISSTNTDILHNKNGANYKIWDASNLPTPASTSDIPDVSDMARRSEANTFTANNTFTAGQFNVGALEVSSLSSIVVNLSGGGEWARTLSFLMESDTSSQICFGAHSNTTNTDNYAYIGIGDVNNSTAQYRFYSNKVLVPETWTLADFNGRGILVIQDTTTSTFGRINGTTYIRGGNTDLYHIKGSTNYKILDESNYSQYLPTTSKWTYGFVTINPKGNNVDFNTVLSGPDSPKILLNYDHELGNDTNAPTDMKYGAVLQIDGNYNSSYNNVALRPQLAFDVNHNVAGGTRYMWFRTANNLGFGDSSNWKRVVTADEDVTMLLVDTNGYPTIKNSNGTEYQWLRTPTSGLLPNKQVSLAGGGNSYIGTSDWYFQRAYIANVYANKFITSGGSSSQFLKGDGSLDSTAYYPNVGRGYFSFDSAGRPLVPNNQGYSAKDKDGIAREIMWLGSNNTMYIGNISSNTAILDIVFRYGEGHTLAVSSIASQSWATTQLAKYLPLTGGTLTGILNLITEKSYPLFLDNTNESSSEVGLSLKLRGKINGYVGCNSTIGTFIQNYTGSILCVKDNGAYYGTTPNILVKLLTSTDLSGYATQSWVTSQGYLKSHQTIYALTFAAGAFAAKTFTPTSAAATVNIPTKTSHLTNDSGFLTSITKSMVTTALGYTPPTTNTTYSQATSSTLGLVKIGATGLAAKNYAVQLNSSGQMYVAVPWTDTNSTYSAATSSTYGLVKIGATGLASKNYAVQLNSSGQMYVSVPWTDTDTNTHYTTKLYTGASGTAANSAISNPYLKVTDDNTYRNQVRFIGAGATSISSDASGNITITSTNTTYGLATASSNGLMSSSQYTKLSNCIETVSATNMVTSVQVVDTIPATSSQVTGRLYLKFA